VTLTYTLPAKPAAPVTLTIGGAGPGTWLGVASSGELSSQVGAGNGFGQSAEPGATGWHSVPGGAALTFSPGYGEITPNPAAAHVIGESVAGQVTLTATGAAPRTVPAIATSAFIDANKTGLGDTVSTTIGGVTVPARIVAVVSEFPTITGSALIMDLPTLQAFLVSKGGTPLGVAQWWLATAGHQVPASLARTLPPGAAITSSAALASAAAADPLSAAPQQALLAMAAAAALLAITGFWVSIAADVRQRRAENALLAALGVAQRSAAAQLFIEKLLLSVPAAALGLILGTVVARLLVPAVTLTTTAQQPVPPPVTLFDLSQTVPLALAVAVIPALAAAFVVFRRPDPAAELRAAEAA
jgi:ABC-type antimicrobial peptide transport system permease subunit